MSSSLDEFKQYLPKYLSPKQTDDLFQNLKDFPFNIDERLYTNYLRDREIIYQGDGYNSLLVVNLPDPNIKPIPGMIISNTCDVEPENPRPLPIRICYSPIIQVQKYKELIIKSGIYTEKQADSHIATVKEQRVSHMFYLPLGGELKQDGLVFFDRICSCSDDIIPKKEIPKMRLFTLSDYGAYLFLYKLSMHFTRVTDEVVRN